MPGEAWPRACLCRSSDAGGSVGAGDGVGVSSNRGRIVRMRSSTPGAIRCEEKHHTKMFLCT